MTSTDPEREAVRKTIQQYIDGSYSGDVEKLRSTFHPKALMSGYLQGQLLIGDPEPFFADMEKNPSMSETDVPYKAEIESINVAGQVASVTLLETDFFGGMNFTNYFHLLKDKGEWKIISKTFTSE